MAARPPNLYYYASSHMNKNYDGSSIEGGVGTNVFFPNGAAFVPPQQGYPHPYAMNQPHSQSEPPFEEERCGRSVSPILAMLFVLFFVAFLATLIVWAIMTNGFRTMSKYEILNVSTTTQTIGGIQSQIKYDSNVCQTSDCLQIAAQMLKRMDFNADPCDNFYQFACGNYANSVALPEDKRSIAPLDEMEMALHMQLRTILEKTGSDSDLISARLARSFYRSCANVASVEANGMVPLKTLMHEMGAWPLFDSAWNERNFKWEKVEANFRRRLGVESLLSIYLVEDFKDSSRRTIAIDQPSLNLGSRDYYLKGKKTNVVKAYLQYMIESVVLLGASEEEAKRQMEDVLDFEISLANISIADEERRDHSSMYNPTTLKDLKETINDIKWADCIQSTFPQQLNISENEQINVLSMKYLQQLPSLVRSTPAATLANYQLWNLVVSTVDFMPVANRQTYRKFQQVLTGVKSDMPRWEECVRATSSFLPWPVGALFVNNFFQKEAKQEMEILVANLRHAMREQIRNADWMDSETRRHALNKLSKMVQKVGYPDYINNETKILEDFESIQELSDESYLINAVSINTAKIERQLMKLREPVDKNEWSSQPAIVNAFYVANANEISFPAGILQFPAFAAQAPKYVFYPRIGAAIGHEITHGYDDEGRQYDENGNLFDWWSETTTNQFKNKAECFVHQYDSITEPITGKNLNGKLTLGENIADNGGLKVAEKAYQIWMQQNGNISEPKLPGFANYTIQKLFFLGYANLWCETMRPESVDVMLTVDAHSLASYRINVPLQNYPSFSEAWNCPLNSKMNPTHKCSIW